MYRNRRRSAPMVRLCILILVAVLLAPPPAGAQLTESQRAVLVTGATSGIGLAMAELLSQNGFFVYAGARKQEDMARLDAMPNVKAVRLDVTIQSDIDAAVETVRAEGRGLYGLINNAGIAVMAPLIEMRDQDMHAQLDVNLFGPYRVTKAFADLIIESRGRIMTTSSIAGIVAGPMSGAYSMSKHGVEAYTDALAAEVARFGVQVAAVEPGNYRSRILESMVRRFEETGYAPPPDSRYGSMLDIIPAPLDRSQYEEPDDVAAAALHFMTSEAPKRRYMVVPSQFEAELTIRQALQEMVELNEGHRFSYSRDDLVRMLDEALGTSAPGGAEPGSTAAPGSLSQAAAEGDVGAALAALEAGADVNEPEPMGGSSPLITAATFGHADVVKALIDAGADIDFRNNDGSTALLTAALFCRTDIVELLLDAGADKSIANNTGATPLDVVSAPFEQMVGVYDFLSSVLGPYGLELDYAHLEETRPKIAEMLR